MNSNVVLAWGVLFQTEELKRLLHYIFYKLPFLMKAYHDHKDDFSSHSCSGVRATGIMLGKPPGVTTTNTLGMEQKENQAAVGS